MNSELLGCGPSSRSEGTNQARTGERSGIAVARPCSRDRKRLTAGDRSGATCRGRARRDGRRHPPCSIDQSGNGSAGWFAWRRLSAWTTASVVTAIAIATSCSCRGRTIVRSYPSGVAAVFECDPSRSYLGNPDFSCGREVVPVSRADVQAGAHSTAHSRGLMLVVDFCCDPPEVGLSASITANPIWNEPSFAEELVTKEHHRAVRRPHREFVEASSWGRRVVPFAP